MPDRSAAPRSPHPGRLALAALFVGAIGIAFSPIFVRLSEVGPTATAFWRTGLAMPVLFLWLVVERARSFAPSRRASRRERLLLGAAGLAFAGDIAFWHWSIRYTSVANATLLANFVPIFVAPAAWILFGERFGAAFLAGLVLAVAGAAMLMGGSVSLGGSALLGDGLGVVTALFYASYVIAVSGLRSTCSTATIMAWSAAGTTLVLLPVTIASGESLLPATPEGWAVLAGLALVSQAGGQSLIAYALAHLPASFSSVALLLQPALAAVLAWILLGEALGALQVAGGVLVLAGIVLARRTSRS